MIWQIPDLASMQQEKKNSLISSARDFVNGDSGKQLLHKKLYNQVSYIRLISLNNAVWLMALMYVKRETIKCLKKTLPF